MVFGVFEVALGVLGFDVAVDELHEKGLFELDPLLELLLGGVHGEFGHHLDGFVGLARDEQVGQPLVHIGHGLGELGVLEGVDALAHVGLHLVVHPVAGVGHAVVDPEGRLGRVVQEVAVALPETVGDGGRADVDGGEPGGGGIVHAEPDERSCGIGQVGTGLLISSESSP